MLKLVFLNVLLKEKFFYKSAFEQAVISIANFIVIVLSSNILNATEHGKFSIVLATLFAFQMINIAFLYGGTFISLKDKRNLPDYRNFLLIMALISGFIYSLAFSLGVSFLGLINNFEILILSAFLIFFQVLSDHIRLDYYIFKIGKMPVNLVLLSVISRIILLLFASSLLEFIIYIIFSNVFFIPRISNLLIRIRINKLNFLEKFNIHSKNSSRMTISACLNWVWNFFPIYLIGGYVDIALAGVLYSLRSLANIHHPLSSLFETYAPSKIFNNLKINPENFIKRSIMLAFILWVPILIILIFFSEQILGTIFGNNFGSYTNEILILWVCSGVVIFSKSLVLLSRRYEKLSLELKGSIYSSLFTLTIGSYLILSYDLIGGAVTFLLAGLVFSLTLVLGLRNK